MALLMRRKSGHTGTGKADPAASENCVAQRRALIDAVRTLLVYVQDFALDLKNLDAEDFKRQISELSDTFQPDSDPEVMEKRFNRQKKRIADYIGTQNKYLRDSEAELRDIIDLLTRAMINLDADNQAFNERMMARSQRIEQVTLLDDIKKIKQALLSEIDGVRQTVAYKSQNDRQQIELLSQKVQHLDRELKQTQEASMKDALTGIFNRGAFDARIRQSVERNMVSKAPFSLLMIDIDDFKRINDIHGHQVGDRVLAAIARKCAASIRSEDMVARYGGEEFVILLQGASLRNSVKKAREICQRIASTSYALDGNLSGQVLTVTVSIGVSTYKKGDRSDDMIGRADKALYAAKQGGKNRVASEKSVS